MGIKDNFHQAFRELLGVSNSDERARTNSNLDSVFETRSAASSQETSAASGNDRPAPNVKAENGGFGEAGYAPNDASVSGPKGEPELIDILKQSRMINSPNDFGSYVLTSPDPDEETTVISKNTMVVGNIHSLANVTIDGKVRGKVNSLKDVTLRGALIGDLLCSNTSMEGSSLEGNVLAKGGVHIDRSSILLGDLNAQISSIDGKVRGNLEIGDRVYLHNNAIVVGNINTTKITVEEGANIKGYVKTAFLAEHDDTAFPAQIVIENEDKDPNDWETE